MFDSKKAFAKAMIDGRRFIDKCDYTYFAEWVDNELKFFLHRPHSNEPEILKGAWDHYNHVTEVPPWYKNIPEHGVLCWVRNSEAAQWGIDIISRYESALALPYRSNNTNGWRYAVPLTNDEIKQFLR